MKKTITLLLCFFAFTFVFVSSCKDEDPESNEPADASSYDQIQDKIFNKSCALAGCHSASSDGTFNQHKLVLAAGVSYSNIVNVAANNAAASAEGFKRVSPGDPGKSFLLHKLECDLGHHAESFGNPMPLGKEPLSRGQIEFLTRWIEQGAPETGNIDADTTLLDDNIPACDEDFTPLAPPAAGTGFQLKVSPFEVKPSFEREIFVYKQVPNPTEVYINRVEMKMRRNSHHFLVNTFNSSTPTQIIPQTDAIRDLRDGNGKYNFTTMAQMQYHDYFIASQTSSLDYSFPTGVALKIPANHKLDVNLHYVNKSQSTTILGECYVNLYTVEAAQVQKEAKTLFLNNTSFTLPANQRTVVTKTFLASEVMNIFMLTSHTHKLAEKFEILVKGGSRDGEVVFTTLSWDHPDVRAFSTPLTLQPGEGLTMRVTYNNTSDKQVSFGLTSEDEMGIIYGYYY